METKKKNNQKTHQNKTKSATQTNQQNPNQTKNPQTNRITNKTKQSPTTKLDHNYRGLTLCKVKLNGPSEGFFQS